MRMNEQVNFYRATILDATKLYEYKTALCGNVHIIFAKVDDSYRIHSFLFPKEKYTIQTATIKAHIMESLLI